VTDPKVVSAIVCRAGRVSHAASLQQSKQSLDRDRFDLVILDLGLPDGSGLDLLPLINSADDPPAVLVFSAHELSPNLTNEVGAALVKSQTDNFRLRKTVNALLGHDWEYAGD